MSAKFVVVLALAVAASALPVVPVGKIAYAEAPAQYDFQYSVHDGQSGDVKQQQENRDGDAVHGSYSLVQPDGVHRIVEYTADKEHGFIANVAYSAPVAYAAPVAKVAYSAPLTHVSYSSPSISYQH
ncbi:cuticle protein-like [Vanessa atalanta]|uniref:cuticle protein-like n=1 Tax=Vanessa atalanta TaxID=42275 RepID=UPI001FCD1032|nr:cuticle protein-like [Vanessa atalanta]